MTRRVLIISYYWPPTGGSGVQRWVKFSKYLPSEGWQPVIYTPLNPEAITTDESLSGEIPPEVEVVKRKIVEPYNIYRSLISLGKKSKTASGEVNPINSQKKTFIQKVSMWIRGNLFIPDPRCTWIGPSVRFLEKYLKEHPVDVIVSTGPPHSMHLIALKLARRTGLPWVADVRDPWTKMFYFKHLGLNGFSQARHRKLEKKVLDNASVVVAVSPLVQEEFRQMTSTDVALITNGFDPCDFDVDAREDGYFNITHTGLFAADGNPETLWKVLRDKCREDDLFKSRLRIRLAGKTDKQIIESIRNASLSENLVDCGYIPHIQAVREQKGATLLILPLRKEPEYRATLPGKLFEYLASGRPVLGIGQKDGAMARILDETSAGVVFDWDEELQIRTCLDAAWDEFLSNGGKVQSKAHGIEKYSRKELTKQMAALLEGLTKEK